MKTPSNDLWKLIRSLTVSEKGYFIKFSGRHSPGKENNYLKLFEEINKQTEKYDEDIIKRKFKKERFIVQLTSAKNYLYNMILKSLVTYNEDRSTESILSNMKEQYILLFQKTLFDQAEKILIRSKKLALDEEKFTKLIDIYKDQKNFDYRKIADPDFEDYVESSRKEELEVLKKQINIAEYNSLYLLMSSVFKKTGIVRNKKDARDFEKIIKHPLMENESMAKSVRAKNLFYIVNYLYYYSTSDNSRAFEFAQKRLKLIENNPLKIAGSKKEFLYALSDAIAMSYNLKRFDLCLTYLRKQREISDRSGAVSSKTPNFLDMYFKSYSFELNIYIISGYFKEGLELVSEVRKWLDIYSGKLNKSEELKVLYSISYLYFGTGDFSNSLYWLNKILNDKSDIRIDYKTFAKILNLIIHYELENYDLMDYEYKSIKRYLTKKDKLYDYENLILNTVKDLPGLSDKKERNFELEMLRRNITTLLKSNEINNYKALEYFDILAWIESKMTPKNFSEIIKSNSKIKLSDLKI